MSKAKFRIMPVKVMTVGKGRRRTTGGSKTRSSLLGDMPDADTFMHRPHPRAGYADAAEPRKWYKTPLGIARKVKQERLVSRGLRKIGATRLAAAAHVAGYGKKPTVKKKRTVRGGGVRSGSLPTRLLGRVSLLT